MDFRYTTTRKAMFSDPSRWDSSTEIFHISKAKDYCSPRTECSTVLFYLPNKNIVCSGLSSGAVVLVGFFKQKVCGC
jgi:hypothetical protein